MLCKEYYWPTNTTYHKSLASVFYAFFYHKVWPIWDHLFSMKNPANRLKLETMYFRCKIGKKIGNKTNPRF